jgi:hypothetical protein
VENSKGTPDASSIAIAITTITAIATTTLDVTATTTTIATATTTHQHYEIKK